MKKLSKETYIGDLIHLAAKNFKDGFFEYFTNIVEQFGAKIIERHVNEKSTKLDRDQYIIYYKDIHWSITFSEREMMGNIREDFSRPAGMRLYTALYSNLQDLFEAFDSKIKMYYHVLDPVQRKNKLGDMAPDLDQMGMFEIKKFANI